MKFKIKAASSFQYVIRVKITYDNGEKHIGYWCDDDESGHLEEAKIFSNEWEAMEICDININDLNDDEIKKVYEIVEVETVINLTNNIVKKYTNK